MKSKLKVLSLFDGMSGGQQALDRSGIKVKKYFASEVDKYAIQVTQKNYPDTIQLGSVTELKKIKDLDLIIGGSPCQGFSIAGKMKGMVTKCNKDITTLKQYKKLKKEGFEFDGQSYLFWEYVRMLKKCKPKYFILENVRVQKKWVDTFNAALWGIEPVLINSALVSAQNRQRYYWVGERQDDGSYKQVSISQPEDRGIVLRDILIDSVVKGLEEGDRVPKLKVKEATKKGYTEIENGDCFDAAVPNSKTRRGRNMKDKSNALLTSNEFMRYEHPTYRKLTPLECERLQTVDDNYTEGVSNSQRYKMLGNGFTIEVMVHILKETLL